MSLAALLLTSFQLLLVQLSQISPTRQHTHTQTKNKKQKAKIKKQPHKNKQAKLAPKTHSQPCKVVRQGW